MIFDIKIGELLIMSLFFVTSFSCILTYFCCAKSLNILEKDKSVGKAVNKLRIFDQYILSKLNLIVALFYFWISYLFVDSVNDSNYVFCLACLLSFVLTLVTTFVSRLCYCYTCNALLDTKLDEMECLVINFKRLLMIHLPFFIISFVLPTIYLINIDVFYCNIISVISLIIILVIWVMLTPKIMVFNNSAKEIDKNSMLRYRLSQLLDAHGIKKYKLYYWDTSRSKESNAMVSGIRTCHLFISSTLIEEVTLPELETVITHEIGHIKSRHLIKMLIGKLFVVSLLIAMIVIPRFVDVDKSLFYLLMVLIVCLSLIIGSGVERKYESEADNYAACYNDPELFASALRKIVKYEDEKKGKIDELFQSHPDIKERIENIKKNN